MKCVDTEYIYDIKGFNREVFSNWTFVCPNIGSISLRCFIVLMEAFRLCPPDMYMYEYAHI